MACEDVNISIIGGTRGLGYWLARMLKKDKFNVLITSRNKTSGLKAASKIGVDYCNDNIKALENADIVIFAVPIEVMVDTIKEVAPHASEGTLLIDITSVKTAPSRALEDYAPTDCDILPCHPMFGPRIPSLEGQVVILTPIEDRCNKWYDKVYNYLYNHDAHIVKSTPQEHDKTMSVVQGLTHFSYISIASTIRKLQISVQKSREFASPVYSLMLDMISRIVSQNPYLYYSIQKNNPQTSISRRMLIEENNRLTKLIEDGKEEDFVENMSDSAKFLDEFEEALGRSDKAINALSEDLRTIKSSLGKEMGFKHQYTGNIHIGEVIDVDSDTVVIKNIHDKTTKLKISNINILSDEEVFEWKKNNLVLHEFDISVLLPKTCNKDVLIHMFENIEPVVSVKLIDTYTGSKIDKNMCSYTFHYKTFNKNDHFIIEDYLTGIGGKIH